MAKKKDWSIFPDWVEGFIIFIGLLLLILSLGTLFPGAEDVEKEEPEKDAKRKDLERELKKTEDRIAILQPLRKKLEKRFKLYVIWARIVIGLGIVTANIFYLHHYTVETFDDYLAKIGTMNGTLLLFYALFAFVSYGTPENLGRVIKIKINKWVTRNDSENLTELKTLENHKQTLKLQLKELVDKKEIET